MKRRRHPQPTDSRRGIILLVVLSLLTLFLVVGLTFVLYADTELESSRNARDAAAFAVPDMDPEQAFAYAMAQLIYDSPDDETGVWSSFRGHSLARNMYGWNYTIQPNNTIVPG